MQILEEIGLLLVPSVRGFMYLSSFIKNGILPGTIIVQGKDSLRSTLDLYPSDFFFQYSDYFSPEKDLDFYRLKYDLNVIQLENKDINSNELRLAVERSKQKYFVYSGGGIIRAPLFETNKIFIHAHSGKLPNYKGSTCLYYSMLKEQLCTATSYFMVSEIDAGNVILSKSFDVPRIPKKYLFFFDIIYDSWIRAEVLDLTLKSFLANGKFDAKLQPKDTGEFYYVIHPFLKNAAISMYTLDCNTMSSKSTFSVAPTGEEHA